LCQCLAVSGAVDVEFHGGWRCHAGRRFCRVSTVHCPLSPDQTSAHRSTLHTRRHASTTASSAPTHPPRLFPPGSLGRAGSQLRVYQPPAQSAGRACRGIQGSRSPWWPAPIGVAALGRAQVTRVVGALPWGGRIEADDGQLGVTIRGRVVLRWRPRWARRVDSGAEERRVDGTHRCLLTWARLDDALGIESGRACEALAGEMGGEPC